MSINLVFDVKGKGGAMVDFPFQTPTNLTYAVLKEKNTDKRLALLRKELESYKWGKKKTEETLNKIKDLMLNPNLKLTMI